MITVLCPLSPSPATNDFFPPIRQEILALGLSLSHELSFELYQAVPFCSPPFLFFFSPSLPPIFDIRECLVIFERSKHSNRTNVTAKRNFHLIVFFFFSLFFFSTNSIKRRIEYCRMEEGEARIRFISFRFVPFPCLFENPYFLCTYTSAYSNGSLNLA